MLGQIIKANLKYYNLNQRELAIKTGLSMQLISEIISNKRKAQVDVILKMEKVFNLEPLSLFFVYQNYLKMIVQKKDKELKIIANYLSTFPKYYLWGQESLLKVASQKLQALTLKDKKKEINQEVRGFKKYQEYPLAYFWFALLEQKHKEQKSLGCFKKAAKNIIFKETLDILIGQESIRKRLKKLQLFLSQNGIILINAPFIRNSHIRGIIFKHNDQNFIFMSDMNKREYWYILELMHQLICLYYDYVWPNEKVSKMQVLAIISDYLAKYQKSHPELELAMAFIKKQSNTKINWREINKKTKLKINFGKVEKLVVES